MSNGAAAQGLSSALAPPASGASGSSGGPGGVGRNAGGGGVISGPGGSTAGGGSSSAGGGLSQQHSVAVSLSKTWLEILIKLMRRAGTSTGTSNVVTGNADAAPVPVGSMAGAVTAALKDGMTRDALLVLFERTAAGLAAAAASAAAGSTAGSAPGTSAGAGVGAGNMSRTLVVGSGCELQIRVT